MSTELPRMPARSVKSLGPRFGTVNVAVTGSCVPRANGAIVTLAFAALTSENETRPLPVLMTSTVTEFAPAAIDSNASLSPGRVSVIVRCGVQTPDAMVSVNVFVPVARNCPSP